MTRALTCQVCQTLPRKSPEPSKVGEAKPNQAGVNNQSAPPWRESEWGEGRGEGRWESTIIGPVLLASGEGNPVLSLPETSVCAARSCSRPTICFLWTLCSPLPSPHPPLQATAICCFSGAVATTILARELAYTPLVAYSTGTSVP